MTRHPPPLDDPPQEQPDDARARYAKLLQHHAAIYRPDALSDHPRLELLSATVVVGLSFGLLWSVLMRWGSDVNPELGWLAMWFLGCLVYYLFKAAAVSSFVLDEMIFRLSTRFGFPIQPLFSKRLRDRFTKEFSTVLNIGLMFLIALATVSLIDALFPPPHVRHIPYSGGG